MNLVVRLPFPDASLFPNRKNGKSWKSTNTAKLTQKECGFYATKQAATGFVTPSGYIPLSLLYLTPDGRHRDCDNLLAASKALIDGLAQAIGVDDKKFRPVLVDWIRGTDKAGALIAGVGVQMSLAMEYRESLA